MKIQLIITDYTTTTVGFPNVHVHVRKVVAHCPTPLCSQGYLRAVVFTPLELNQAKEAQSEMAERKIRLAIDSVVHELLLHMKATHGFELEPKNQEG